MGFSSSSFFVSVSSLLVTLFRVFHKLLLRIISFESSKMNSSSCAIVVPKENSQTEQNIPLLDKDEPSHEISDVKGLEEKSKEESFGFTFKFPSFEEFSKSQTENRDSEPISLNVEEESTSFVSNKYDFRSSNHFSFFVKESIFTAQSEFLTEKDFTEEISKPKTDTHANNEDNKATSSDSDSDSTTSSHEFSFMSNDFLSDADFESRQNRDSKTENDGSEEDDDILEELRRLEEKASEDKDESEKNIAGENTPSSSSSSSSSSPLSSSWDSEDSSALESLWEHQELVEQLKMELKKVRATGLPTIMEDSESLKISSDLKPWKIDEKLHRGDKLSDLHKLYKTYRERMRKFDILNYQKMYALGLLQSKDPLQSCSNSKSSTMWGYKRKKTNSDQMANFVRELQSDLEMVYVGQMCLSWEFLQWQYEKAFEIWESDPNGFRHYNEVAGEFQQFQVLLQRFVENEPFQGPRVDNYVKNRCVMRNLLQVPVIREDSKEKKKMRRGLDDGAITGDMLFDILEESIRIIWRFIKADKYTRCSVPKCCKGKDVELQVPTDSDLFVEVQTELQKKDKKLKELLRSGNCIVRKFQKNQDDGSDHLQFFSQVDMRLVARVLNMSRITTDQLVWCHNKLTKINFVKRKIHVEPSFLLFPC